MRIFRIELDLYHSEAFLFPQPGTIEAESLTSVRHRRSEICGVECKPHRIVSLGDGMPDRQTLARYHGGFPHMQLKQSCTMKNEPLRR